MKDSQDPRIMVLTRYVGKIPSFAKHLHTWGEAGTVKFKTATTAKLADKGVQCMFIGYATNIRCGIQLQIGFTIQGM